jgi:release factor glutamine methyltransferase
VWATDISEEALAWARLNSEGIKNVELVRGDLFSGLGSELLGTVDLVVSNPPYLSDVEMSDAPVDVKDHEPALALSGGAEGLEVPARIVREAEAWLSNAGWLVMETSPTQAGQLRELLFQRFEDVHIADDLAGRARIAWGRKPSSG